MATSKEVESLSPWEVRLSEAVASAEGLRYSGRQTLSVEVWLSYDISKSV